RVLELVRRVQALDLVDRALERVLELRPLLDHVLERLRVADRLVLGVQLGADLVQLRAVLLLAERTATSAAAATGGDEHEGEYGPDRQLPHSCLLFWGTSDPTPRAASRRSARHRRRDPR